MLQNLINHIDQIIIGAVVFGGWGAILLITKFQCMSDEEREKWGLGPKGQGRR